MCCVCVLCACRVDHSMTLIEKLIQQIERAVQVRPAAAGSSLAAALRPERHTQGAAGPPGAWHSSKQATEQSQEQGNSCQPISDWWDGWQGGCGECAAGHSQRVSTVLCHAVLCCRC